MKPNEMKSACFVTLLFVGTFLFIFRADSSGPTTYKEIDAIPYFGMEGNAYQRERCKLDLYHPENRKGFPTLVFFHGGGLTGGEKMIPSALRNQEIAVVAPNYRLSGDRAHCPDYIEDAAAAVAWTLKNIAAYGGDPEKVFISGISADGYLSAMVGMAPKYLAAFGCSNMQLAGIFPISGQMTTHYQVKNERGIPNSTTIIDEYAPMMHIAGDLPPIVLVTGDRSLDVPARAEENALLAALLCRVAGNKNVKFFEMGGIDHDLSICACPVIIREMKAICAKRQETVEAKP